MATKATCSEYDIGEYRYKTHKIRKNFYLIGYLVITVAYTKLANQGLCDSTFMHGDGLILSTSVVYIPMCNDIEKNLH